MYVNIYGPTEITCNCTYYIVDREFQPGDVLPMGKAFPNEKVFLLDEEDKLITEKNKNGELCVTGSALALGYYKNREQTAKVFVQNPLNDRYLEPMYRTGDLAYYNERGELCFATRKDFQIKHMGHRIELGEIEAAMDKVPEIVRSCCIFDTVKSKIVAFYEGDIERRPLAKALGQYVPAFMVPNVFRQVESMPLTKNGKAKFAEATKANVGKQIAIVYDDQVLSAPNVNEEISGGKAQITGMASTEEAQNLASYIRIGSLSLELTELRSSVVAAQLGEEAIATSVKAGAIGLVIVMLIMIIAYRIPGLVASVALVLYTTLMLITLNAFDITLTLPGIAGIILGIGMAVDANVIIYARIREEIAAGLSVHAAIKSGFGKAFSAIFDGNITTLIAACVLMWLGSGSVKGFAYTLAMGIVISMFTALVISRLVINAVYAIGVRDPKFYGIAKERKVVDFVGKRKIFFAVSIILILCGPVGMLVHSNVIGDKAMNYSLEFSGGTSTNVTFNKEMDIKEIDSEVTPVVEAVTGDKNVQPTKVQGTNQVVIKTRSLDLKEREALNKALEENFDVDTSLITSENISATVSNEMRRDAIVAVIVAAIFMLLYIWFRFKDIRFASSAVLALLHDVLVVLAFYVISRTSVGNTFIACMLTIVGYSINATIVIFDRIRENMRGRKKVEDEKLKEIVNTSVTETLTRSIYTSLTTFVMVAILYVMGVSSIKEFAAPLMVGIVGGAYSSVCITGALWYTMKTFRKNRVAAPAAVAASAKISSEKSEKKVKQPSGQQTAQQPKKKNRKRVAERLAAQEAAKQQNDEEKSE